MPRSAVNKQLHTDDVKIDQKPAIIENERAEEIVQADESVLRDMDYVNELKFNEDPVTIRIEPSSERNASSVHPVWCNGKGAEVFIRDRWREVTWLPVNIDLIVKRKYVAIMMSAKIDRVETQIIKNMDSEENRVNRITTPVCTFSIVNDPNPRGRDWFIQMRQRNM